MLSKLKFSGKCGREMDRFKVLLFKIFQTCANNSSVNFVNPSVQLNIVKKQYKFTEIRNLVDYWLLADM
jgi:hypothetical protein